MTAENHIHIISFNVPFPANYGGVIDVFYKIKNLHEAGVKVHLHCFKYGRSEAKELESICYKVHYYKRKTGFLKSLSLVPYIISSRKSGLLISMLLKDDYPILFEGLHCCYYLDDERLKNRFKIFRESNIEHEYYWGLAKAENNYLKKLYFLFAGWKLKRFEKIVKHASLILPVSQTDTEYFKQKFTNNKVEYLPSFHPFNNLVFKQGKGEYFLYHGNLEVSENIIAAKYLITEVFNDLDLSLIIAGLNPSNDLLNLASEFKNIKIIPNPTDSELQALVENAQANALVTFQATGLKLKLLNVLYNGRFCIANSEMLQGTGLDKLCIIADSKDRLKKEVQAIADKDFDLEEFNKREKILEPYSNEIKTKKLIQLAFPQE